MILLNERNQVRTVADQWTEQYPVGKKHAVDKVEKRKALQQLDPETATAADVAKIIGNTSWARAQTCDECKKESWECVQLGEEPNYESATATICPDCLRAALKLIEDARE